ncbi:ZFYV1 protein, partial [Polypterus senegalus]
MPCRLRVGGTGFEEEPLAAWGGVWKRTNRNREMLCRLRLGETSFESKVEPTGLIARKVTEVAQSTLDFVSTAVEYPLGFVKEVARPDYWVPDNEIVKCHNCSIPFTPMMSKHHCRSCGQGVCDHCSTKRRPVPSRGWDHPVRICDECCS